MMKELWIAGLALVVLIVLAFVIQHFWTRRVVTLVSESVVEATAQAPRKCSRCTTQVPPWFLESLGGEEICFNCTANYAYPAPGEDEDTYTVKLQKDKEAKRAAAREMGPDNLRHIFDDPPGGGT